MTEAVALIEGGRLSWPFLLPEKCRALDRIDDDSTLEAVYTMAAEFLWRWTGQRFGTQELTAHPEVRGNGPSAALMGSTFYGKGPYGPRQMAWPGRIRRPREAIGARVFLQSPVEVVEVKIDGHTLDMSEYFLEGSTLVRSDGSLWPTAPDAGLTITYVSGQPVPEGGRIATGVLTCEFAMSITNDPDCSLPQRLQSVTREGISMTVLDEFEDLDDGRTGIWLIDNWVASVTRSPRGASVLSPERPRFGGLR